MTRTWAYIGDLGPEGQLDWGGDWDGNIPRSGKLPDLDGRTWSLVLKLVRDGLWESRQTDWGAFALRVNGPRLIAFLTEAYGAAVDAPEGTLARYVALASELSEDGFMALVAAEL